jgi:hypothetical protein
MKIQVQCKDQDGEWRCEIWHSSLFSAYLTAKAKSIVTGRTYRLVGSDGSIVEVVRGEQASDQ